MERQRRRANRRSATCSASALPQKPPLRLRSHPRLPPSPRLPNRLQPTQQPPRPPRPPKKSRRSSVEVTPPRPPTAEWETSSESEQNRPPPPQLLRLLLSPLPLPRRRSPPRRSRPPNQLSRQQLRPPRSFRSSRSRRAPRPRGMTHSDLEIREQAHQPLQRLQQRKNRIRLPRPRLLPHRLQPRYRSRKSPGSSQRPRTVPTTRIRSPWARPLRSQPLRRGRPRPPAGPSGPEWAPAATSSRRFRRGSR